MEVDPKFTKFLERLRALPESRKKELRDTIYRDAGNTPPEDTETDQPCGDNPNGKTQEPAPPERTPVSPTYNPETCGHPPDEPCTICKFCRKCKDTWCDETFEVCSDCYTAHERWVHRTDTKACWYCGSTEDVKYRLCGRCSLEHNLDGVCGVCKTAKPELDGDGVCLECRIRDKMEFRREIMRWATEDHIVEVGDGKKTKLEGGELTNFLMALAEYVELFEKLEKRLGDDRPVNALLKAELGKKMELGIKDKLELVARELKAEGFTSHMERTIWDLISSADYKRLLDLHRRVRDYDKPPFVVSTNGTQLTIEDRRQLLEHIMAHAAAAPKDVGIPETKRPVSPQLDSTSGTGKAASTRTDTFQSATDLRGLAKVAGMRELKALLEKDVVQAFRKPDLFNRYGLSIPHGILLFGPPGCGKTYIARQLAEELGCAFVESRQSDVAGVYIHESSIKIRDLFETAEKSAPSVLFIDEFDGMVPSRAGLGSHQQFKSEEVNEFLSQLNECGRKRILVIAATNEPEKIDSAVLRTGRMDKLIYVGPPDSDARFEMLRFHLSNRPTDSPLDLRGIAAILDGYSASDIRFLVDEAARAALDQKTIISTELVMDALHRVPPSISVEVQERYRSFGSRGT